MSKRLLAIVLAAAAGAGASAAAQPSLPDFPTDAQPGGCYARLPSGTVAQVGPATGPAVWTLRRGSGPTAIWSYSHAGEPVMGLGGGPLAWAQVDCASGRPLAPVQHAAAPLARPAHPPMTGPVPMARLAPQPAFPPAPPFRPDAPPPPPSSDPGPYADASPAARPPHAIPPAGFAGGHAQPSMGPGLFAHRFVPMAGPHPGPFGPMAYHGVPPHRAFAPPPPARPPVAPWFGGRMLTWPGKTLR